MEKYLQNENIWLFWTCMATAAIACFFIVRYYWLSCKVITPTIEDENPIKYKIDGEIMGEKEAERYYYSELGRHRRKNTLHLIVYDFENNILMYDGLANKYFEKPSHIIP